MKKCLRKNVLVSFLFAYFLFSKCLNFSFRQVIYASAWDIEYVSIYRFPNHDAAAYAIVSFKSHRNAALARRKLRPEKLFKCNEVHVEWARVDWNPSNVVSRQFLFFFLRFSREHIRFQRLKLKHRNLI